MRPPPHLSKENYVCTPKLCARNFNLQISQKTKRKKNAVQEEHVASFVRDDRNVLACDSITPLLGCVLVGRAEC